MRGPCEAQRRHERSRCGDRRHGGVSKSGMTLAELMIVIVIIAILAGMAVPNYRKTLERSYVRGAQDLLMMIYSGERAYAFVNNGAYYVPGNWNVIYTDNPNIGSIPVSFSVATGAGSFVATATRTGGPCGGMTLTIDQNRAIGGNWPTCPSL